MSEQIGIRSFVRVSMFNNADDGKFQIFSNTANSSGIELAAERVFASANGTQRIAWDLGRTVTFSLEMEVFDWSFLAMMAGQDDVNKEAFDILRRQVGTVSGASGEVELLGVPVAGSLSVCKYDSIKGAKGEEIDFSLDGTTLTVEVTETTEIMIAYFENVADCEVITFNADRFPPSYYIVGDFEYRDAATGADKWAQLHILNARPQADLSLALGNEVTSLSITFDALATGRGDMFHIVKINDGRGMEVGGGGLIGSDFGFGGSQGNE